MKKIIAVALLCGIMLALSACGKSFTCDLCMEEKSGKKHTADVFGEEITVCNDCLKEISELMGE